MHALRTLLILLVVASPALAEKTRVYFGDTHLHSSLSAATA